jgi:glutaredoxin
MVDLVVLDQQEDYQAVREEMVRLAGGKTSVPQIFIRGELVPGGFTGLKELNDKGLLDEMLLAKIPDEKENAPFWNPALKLKFQSLVGSRRELKASDFEHMDF